MSSTTATTEAKTSISLNTRITTAPASSNNLGTVRKLNAVIFPVKYAESFYKLVIQPELEEFCKLIYFNDIPVGTTCSRIEKGAKEGEARLYMMTMGVLAPYRKFGAGTVALKEVIRAAEATPTAPKQPRITHIYLHVQVSNEDARRFYEKHGFKVVKEVEGYYKRIEPHNAWLLEREIQHAPKA